MKKENSYLNLFNHCVAISQKVNRLNLQLHQTPQIGYVYHKLMELKDFELAPFDSALSPSFLNYFDSNCQAILEGKIDVLKYFSENAQAWSLFMTEFPLGVYAEKLANFLIEKQLIQGNILELGAGVGNTSRLIQSHLRADCYYLRSDLNIKLPKEFNYGGIPTYYDFNKPGRWKNLDLIFATNAIHCAKNKSETLNYLREMLNKDSILIFSEGSPTTKQNCPFAIDFLCGFFDGWWDQGGFLTGEVWQDLLYQANFSEVQTFPITIESHVIGNIIFSKV